MSAEIIFQSELYSMPAIEAAAAAFAELATIAIEQVEDNIVVRATEIDPDVADVFADELANFALHETIERARSAS